MLSIAMLAVLRSTAVRGAFVRQEADRLARGMGKDGLPQVKAALGLSFILLIFLTRWGARWLTGAGQGRVGLADSVSTAYF